MKKTEKTLFFLLFIFCAISFFKPIETGDIWWHLKAGKFIVENRSVPYLDPFPFAEEKTPWILTQWLGSLFYYSIYAFSGLAGLQVLRSFLFLLILLVFVLYARNKIPPTLLGWIIFLMSFGLATRCLLRPFVFNFFFIQLFLIILFQFQKTRNNKYLLAIPLGGFIWINTHLGSFMYGVSLIATFLFSEIFRAIDIFIQKPSDQQDAWQAGLNTSIRSITELSVVLLIYLLLFLITPYGIDGALHPIKTIIFKEYLNFYAISSSVSELLPPMRLLSFQYFWFYPFLALGVASVFLDKKFALRNALLLICALFLFIYGRRANVFLILICSYIFVESTARLSLMKRWSSQGRSAMIEKLLKITLLILLCLNIYGTVRSKYIYDHKIFGYFSIRKNFDTPFGSLRTLADNDITGRIFNDDKYGGYILWQNYPDLRPFVDSRQINYRAFDIYHSVRKNPALNWPILEGTLNFNIVLLDASKRSNNKMLIYFMANPNWRLIHVDGNAVLFVREGAFDLPANLLQYEQNLMKESLDLETFKIQAQDLLSEKISWKDRIIRLFRPKYSYVESIATGITLYDLGFKAAGIRKVLEGYVIDHSPHTKNMLRLMYVNLD